VCPPKGVLPLFVFSGSWSHSIFPRGDDSIPVKVHALPSFLGSPFILWMALYSTFPPNPSFCPHITFHPMQRLYPISPQLPSQDNVFFYDILPIPAPLFCTFKCFFNMPMFRTKDIFRTPSGRRVRNFGH